jgi:hypothetical protein
MKIGPVTAKIEPNIRAGERTSGKRERPNDSAMSPFLNADHSNEHGFRTARELSLNKQLNSQLLCAAYFVNFGNLGSM